MQGGDFDYVWKLMDPEGHARSKARGEEFHQKLLAKQREEHIGDSLDWLHHEADRLMAMHKAAQPIDPKYVGMEIIARVAMLRQVNFHMQALRVREWFDRDCEGTDRPKQWKPTHRHLKSGGLYRELLRGTQEATLEHVVIYENRIGQVWVRPKAEFDDGRFERLPESDIVEARA